jgi:hypothetical protein
VDLEGQVVDTATPLPADLARIAQRNDSVLDSALVEPGVLCAFDGRYFVRALAELPLDPRDDQPPERASRPTHEVWIELTGDEFGRFLEADEDPDQWHTFRTEGTLASEWPGFSGMLGVPVVAQTTGADLRITEVWVDRREHPEFHQALSGGALPEA